MARRSFFLPGIGILVSIFFPLATFAQVQHTGSIIGRVLDANGGVLPGVAVELMSPALLRSQSTATDDKGSFIERIQAPLLILHGTNDPNVTLLQSVLLVDRLLKHGKRFEFEIYPGELHFFTKKRSWVDAFAKMARFFDQNLGRLPGSARTTDNPGSH